MNVPEETILTEEISNNTKENAIASLSVLEDKCRNIEVTRQGDRTLSNSD